MTYSRLRRITLSTGIVAIVAALIGEFIRYGLVREVYGAALPAVASVVSAVPVAVAIIFLVVQVVPSGRFIVNTPGTKGVDAWIMLLILTQAVPLVELGRYVPAGWWGSGNGDLYVGLYALTAAILFRVWQLNRGAKPGALVPGAARRDARVRRLGNY